MARLAVPEDDTEESRGRREAAVSDSGMLINERPCLRPRGHAPRVLSTDGIHGTPQPEEIGKTESHGCNRLTNWDAVAANRGEI